MISSNSKFLKLVLLTTLLTVASARFRRATYEVDATQVKPTEQSNVPTSDNGLGQCSCDMTYKSCDPYCCCDQDCDANIRKYWQSKYKEYCAKNEIHEKNKPNTQCVRKNILYDTNLRMGMKAVSNDDLFCVELDAGGVGSEFLEQRKKTINDVALLNPNLSEITSK